MLRTRREHRAFAFGICNGQRNRLSYNLRPIFEKYKIDRFELNDTV